MSRFKQDIMNYGDDVTDLESSPFEYLRMLNERTELYANYSKLTYEEQVMLTYCDLKLIENAKPLVEQIEKVYDFALSSNISPDQWWWHLDKITEGVLSFSITAKARNNIMI